MIQDLKFADRFFGDFSQVNWPDATSQPTPNVLNTYIYESTTKKIPISISSAVVTLESEFTK